MKKKISVFVLTLLLHLPTLVLGIAPQNQSLKTLRATQKEQKPKLAPDLEEILAQDDEDQRQEMQGMTLAQARQLRLKNKPAVAVDQSAATTRARINGVLLPAPEALAEEKQSFIVQVAGATPAVVVQEKLAVLGGRISHKLDRMGLLVIEAHAMRFAKSPPIATSPTSARIAR